MSMIKALDDDKLRREAFARAAPKELSYGSAERDFAENGWPMETALGLLKDGLKSGKGAPGWSAAQTEEGKTLWALELPVATGFCRVLLDPAKGEVGVRGSGMSFVADSLESASELIARHTHQAGRASRVADLVSARAGLWQERASHAISEMSAPQAGFRVKAGEDAQDAWDRDFDAVDQRCDAERAPIEAMDRARANYMGSTEKQMAQWVKEEIKAGPNATVEGDPARLMAFGGPSGEIRAAIPLNPDGSVDGERPIMVALGEPGEQGFKHAQSAPQAMRFYSQEAFCKFAASAQSATLSVHPVPEMSVNLAGRRQAAAMAQQTAPRAASAQPRPA